MPKNAFVAFNELFKAVALLHEFVEMFDVYIPAHPVPVLYPSAPTIATVPALFNATDLPNCV